MIEKTTGKLIAFHRHLMGIKQEQLAADAGIPQSSMSEIENDKISPTVNQLTKISQILNIAPAVLLPQNEGDSFNNNFTDSAINHGNNIMHNYGNIEEERKIFRELLEAKDSIIKIKDQIIDNLNSK